MSQENVELARRFWASVPDNVVADREWIDAAFRDYLDEGFEFHLPAGYPEGEQVFRGREGLTQSWAIFRDAWDEFRWESERFFDAGDRVVAFVRIVAKGGASGVPIELKVAHVGTVRDGRITSVRLYRDRSEALEAAGLSE
jgi:ketosteroid isomerase-like protein